MNNKGSVCAPYFCALLIIAAVFSVGGCNSSVSFKQDERLSTSLRNLPPPAVETISEIRIYKTTGSNFLYASEIDNLKPIKVLKTPSEINAFFAVMTNGRVSNQDLTFKNLHYLPECYHIIAFNADKTSYGYLKVQISSDQDKPVVACVRLPDGSNSYEIMTELPDFLTKT
jgi:hypothetical protein